MNECIKKLRDLYAEYNSILQTLTGNLESKSDIHKLKIESIRIESQIHLSIERLRASIINDDSIPTSERDTFLQGQLMNIGIDPEKMAKQRVALVKSAIAKLQHRKEEDMEVLYNNLSSKDNIENFYKIMYSKKEGNESEITKTTERMLKTKLALQEQIRTSKQSIELISNSTSALSDVSDSSSRIISVESRAIVALRKLRMARNLDMYLFRFSIYFFTLCCMITLLRFTARNKLVRLIRFVFSIIAKILGLFYTPKPVNNTRVPRNAHDEL